MFPTPQSPVLCTKGGQQGLASYIDDILGRAQQAADELDALIASLPKETVRLPIQFDKPKFESRSPSLYIPESPRQDISMHSYHHLETPIPLSPTSSRFGDSYINMPMRPSSSCERRPANIRAHRMLASQSPYAIEAEDDYDQEQSFVQPLPSKSRPTRHIQPFVDLTNASLDNLPNFEYVTHQQEVHVSLMSETASHVDEKETAPAWKRERLLLEIMRNYGEEFS